MIDAYEIGIQLALQDDVSAGLQIITRELADVDRAIEATSAKLANLAHVAQSASGAATAGVATRAGGAAATDTTKPPPSETEAPKATGKPASPEREMPRLDPANAAPVSAPDAPSKAPAVSTAPAVVQKDQTWVGPAVEEASAAAPTASPSPVETAAPVAEAPGPSLGAAAPTGPNAPVVTPQRQTADVADVEPAPVAAAPASAPSVAAPLSAGTAPSAQTQRVVTAHVAHVVPPRQGERGSNAAAVPRREMREPRQNGAGKPAAPWSGVDARVLSPPNGGVSERAAAPPSRQNDRSEGGSGTVMLDGHLVGYWLAEQMAKDASRPPSGTSFFDPRQSPAWTASGSL